MIKVLSICWVFLISFDCFQNKKNNQVENNYALVINIYSENNKKYIDADYVQYFTGKKAIEEAKKRNEADKHIINGETVYSVPNDIYIVNENNKIRKLEVSNNVKLDYLKNDYKDKLFLLTIQNEKVVDIKEIITP